MDIRYGSSARDAFVTNVGLITSNGPRGHNIMAAEWTAQISYDPGLLTVSIGPGKATHDNCIASGYFGVTIADASQNVLASVAGGYSGKQYDKIGLLRALGFDFMPAQTIDVLMPTEGMLQAECVLVEHRVQGDHVVMVGEVQRVTADPSRMPLVYHRGQYWHVGEQIEKPSDAQRAAMKELAEAHRKTDA